MADISMNTKHVLTFLTGAALGAFGWNMWIKRKAKVTPSVAQPTLQPATQPILRTTAPTAGAV